MDFDEIGKSTKSLFKNKKFVVLCVIVGMVAIVLWIIKENKKAMSSSSETDYYDGSQAIGYGGYGYPYAGEETDSDYDWFYDKLDGIMDANDEKWQNIVDQMNDKYDQMLDKYDDILDKLDRDNDAENDNYYSGGYVSGGGGGSSINNQAIIDQMYANSNMWWDTVSEADREALHDENIYLAGMIGATYDSSKGLWYGSDGQPLYTVNRGNAIEEAYQTTTGKKTASSPTVTYTQNVDYMAAMTKAINSGASADVINQLDKQRDAKIAATGGSQTSYNPNTDYMALINKAKAAGADQSVIDSLTAQRNAKIADQQKKISSGSGGATSSAGAKRVNMTK